MRHGGSARGPLLLPLGGYRVYVPPVLSLAGQDQGKRMAVERGLEAMARGPFSPPVLVTLDLTFTNISMSLLALAIQQCILAVNLAFTLIIQSVVERRLSHPVRTAPRKQGAARGEGGGGGGGRVDGEGGWMGKKGGEVGLLQIISKFGPNLNFTHLQTL